MEYLVRQQAGTVVAESEGIGKGATFIVEFPVTSLEVIGGDLGLSDEVMLEHKHLESPIDPKLRKRRILLVEDDQDTQELLATVLRRHGAEVLAVSSSADALVEIARSKPDVIISDIGMAGESGYEMIRKVRAPGPRGGGHIPAIALTAYAGVRDRRRALLAGFQTHLSKPVEPDDLVAVILSLTFQQPAEHEDC